MTMTRWSPFEEMQALRNEMNRLFEPFINQEGASGELRRSTWYPAVDVEETRDQIYVRAELPGMTRDDIQVEFENGVLTIRGEKKFDREAKERTYHRIERAYGSFVRTFTLPRTVDAENVTARYENGVLELEMPKRAEAKPRRIEIAGGGSGSRAKEIGPSRAA